MYGLACYIWSRSAGQSATTSNHSATPKHVRHQTPPKKKTSASHSEMRQKKNPKPCILSCRQNFHSSLILLLSAEMEQASSRGVSRLWFASRSSLIALQKAPSPPPTRSAPPTFLVSFTRRPFQSVLRAIIVPVRHSWPSLLHLSKWPGYRTRYAKAEITGRLLDRGGETFGVGWEDWIIFFLFF